MLRLQGVECLINFEQIALMLVSCGRNDEDEIIVRNRHSPMKNREKKIGENLTDFSLTERDSFFLGIFFPISPTFRSVIYEGLARIVCARRSVWIEINFKLFAVGGVFSLSFIIRHFSLQFSGGKINYSISARFWQTFPLIFRCTNSLHCRRICN